MRVHRFSLMISGPDLQSDSVIDALFKAGCADALVGAVGDVQYIDFSRRAASLEEAISSAVANVESLAGVQVTGVAMADSGRARA